MVEVNSISHIDLAFARDLYLFSVNDGEIYERAALPAIAELRRKIKRNLVETISVQQQQAEAAGSATGECARIVTGWHNGSRPYFCHR